MGEVMSTILLERGIVAIPWRLGDVLIRKKKKQFTYNKQLSKKLGRRIYEFNEHSDGYTHNFFWLSPERLHKKRKMFCFAAYRLNQRRLAQLLKNKEVRYPDFEHISKRVLKR